MKLRKYQEEIVTANLHAMDRGVASTLNGLFTGAGKTVIFVTLADRIRGRTLIICPMRELVWQAIDKVREITDSDPDVEMAGYHAEEDWPAKVIVASKQTLLSRRNGEPRYKKFRHFQLVIVDEAHMMCSEPVVEMLRYFQNDGAMVAGFTATPFRMDGRGLLCSSTRSQSATTTCDGQSTTATPARQSAASQRCPPWISEE